MTAEVSTCFGMAQDLSQVPNPDKLAAKVSLEVSHRLTPGVTLHAFSLSPDYNECIEPGGHIEIQFGPELDLIYGARSLTEDERRLSFTPCSVNKNETSGTLKISILAGNGRITQMISAPRLDGALTGILVGSGGGFPPTVFQNAPKTICIASGTGIAPFLSLAGARLPTQCMHLFYTLRGTEFQLVEYLIEQGLLDVSAWKSVNVYITAGNEGGCLVGGKTKAWWWEKFAGLSAEAGPGLKFHCERMSLRNFEELTTLGFTDVLFCGSKSLEWQVKMWFLNRMKVYTTW